MAQVKGAQVRFIEEGSNMVTEGKVPENIGIAAERTGLSKRQEKKRRKGTLSAVAVDLSSSSVMAVSDKPVLSKRQAKKKKKAAGDSVAGGAPKSESGPLSSSVSKPSGTSFSTRQAEKLRRQAAAAGGTERVHTSEAHASKETPTSTSSEIGDIFAVKRTLQEAKRKEEATKRKETASRSSGAVRKVKRRKVTGNSENPFGFDPSKLGPGEFRNDGLGGMLNNEGFTNRRTTDGLKIYKSDVLKVERGGSTPLCPFDCDCCF
uniref:Uncharacterized protein n=1 Tax=Noctiluca scintillans TaxID=2966 RepID=A0A7S0ZTL8_NOCSC